jgi:vitamin B12 transporter
MKSRLVLVAGSLLAVNLHAAYAAETETLDATVVTASRSSETVDASLATVSVLDRADIERTQAPNLLDLLRVQAGIDLARSGGAGSVTSLFLRGSNSNHVLVLVDGVRVSSFNTGALDWSNIPVSQIERIEIVRGPRAAYWGSDAIGGVVQIFTRRNGGAIVSAQAGSYGTRRGQIGWGIEGDHGRFSAFIADERTDGFSSQNERGFGYFPDDDGQRQRSVTLHGGFDIGDSHSLDARVFRADSDVEFDNGDSEATTGPAESEARTQSIALTLAGDLSERWQHQLVVADGRDDLQTPVSGSSFRTRRDSADWQNAVSVAATQTLLFGVNWLDEEGFANDGFGSIYSGDRNNAAAYLGWRGSFAAFDSELVGRYDDNSDFGGEFTGSAALGWRVGERVRLSAGVGEGFRAPNLNELHSPGFGGLFAGNPALEPERSRSVEAGADIDLDNAGELRLRAFRTRIRDMIGFTGGETFQAENTAHARIDGIEAEYGLTAGSWLVNANVTLQDPQNEDTGNMLLRRAKRKGSLSVDREFAGGWRAGIETILSGERKDAGYPDNVVLPGYGVVNLRAAWSVTPAWTLELRADNVADKDYSLIDGYNTPDRSAYVGFRWQPTR